jgi:hypothetical protein
MSDVSIDDLIYMLDQGNRDWRENSFAFDALLFDDIGFRADLVMTFLKADPEYLDDIVPAIIGAPYILSMQTQPKYSALEWVVQVMDNCRAADVLEDTAAQIAQYVSGSAYFWLLEEEERLVSSWV